MRLLLRSPREFLAGVIFVVLGGAAALGSLRYPLGKASEMGPGYFPFVVSLVLAVLGLVSILRSIAFADRERLEPWNIAPLALVLVSVALFAVLIGWAGLLVSSFAAVLASSARRVASRPVETLILAAGTTALVALIFVVMLHLSIPLF